MELEHRVDDDILVVRLVEKRLDARSVSSFREKMNEFITAGYHRIALDISPIEFVDSSGLGALVALLKRLSGQGDLVVCGARETVMSMFKLTRLDKVFHMATGVEGARAALAK